MVKMEIEQAKDNPESEIDTLVNELQTYGDIETMLSNGLSVEQVTTLMMFRAQLVDLIYRGVNTSEDQSILTANAIKQFFGDLEIELLTNGQEFNNPKHYDSQADLLEACKSVVATLMATEAPETDEGPVTQDSFMAIYKAARPTLPIEIVISEILLQINDLKTGSGLWQFQK
jgi:hypothetical protein